MKCYFIKIVSQIFDSYVYCRHSETYQGNLNKELKPVEQACQYSNNQDIDLGDFVSIDVTVESQDYHRIHQETLGMESLYISGR